MATIPAVLHRLRRARRRERDAGSTGQFDEYRPAYEALLTAASEHGGEAALDDVSDWAIEWTKREKQRPPPETFRSNVRRILTSRGVEIPPDSPLAVD